MTRMPMVKIPLYVYIGCLQDRYDAVVPLWGNEASRALWDIFLESFDAYEDSVVEDPKVIVDNYLINGEFANKSDYKEAYSSYLEKHPIDDFDDMPEDEQWEAFCEHMNAYVHDDDYALIQF